MESINPRSYVGRFAPSPSGRMHAGNIFASLIAWLEAKSHGGRILLRIDDLDRQRSKLEYIDALQRDYEYLGLHWDREPAYQSNHHADYEKAFEILSSKGLVYPCFCSRADLHAGSAPHEGERFVYPGTCRILSEEEVTKRSGEREPAYRVKVGNLSTSFDDLLQGRMQQDLPTECGDFIVKRSDGDFAYQLAVVVDDAQQGVSAIVRGCDLVSSTPQQLYLQEILGLTHPDYLHVPLIINEQGRRLSKRDRDTHMEELKARFKSPEAILGHVAWITGLIPTEEPLSAADLLEHYSLDNLKDKQSICWH